MRGFGVWEGGSMTPPTRNPGSTFRTLAMMAGALAIGAPTPTPAPVFRSPVQQSAPAPVREYVAPSKRRLPGKRKKAKQRDPLRQFTWKDNKDGSAMDGRGDYRSPKRLQRQRMCAIYGITSGRQWVRLRKELRRAS